MKLNKLFTAVIIFLSIHTLYGQDVYLKKEKSPLKAKCYINNEKNGTITFSLILKNKTRDSVLFNKEFLFLKICSIHENDSIRFCKTFGTGERSEPTQIQANYTILGPYQKTPLIVDSIMLDNYNEIDVSVRFSFILDSHTISELEQGKKIISTQLSSLPYLDIHYKGYLKHRIKLTSSIIYIPKYK